MARRPLIAGNWKMNGLSSSSATLDRIIAGAAKLPARLDVLICPPFTLIAGFAARARGSRVAIGGQDCHAKPSGAHTGDIAAEMLADARATAVIVGHSERRRDHHETDAQVRAKALAARRAGILPIVCVGETRAERDAGRARAIVGTQLDGSLPDGAPDPQGVALGDSLREAIIDAVGELPERERLVLSLYYEQELNLKEIGAVLKVTESRVCQLHGQALLRLKARLGEWQN